MPYRYHWHRMGRKDQPCRVLVRGELNSCLVEFGDGFRMVTSRNALRRNISNSPGDRSSRTGESVGAVSAPAGWERP